MNENSRRNRTIIFLLLGLAVFLSILIAAVLALRWISLHSLRESGPQKPVNLAQWIEQLRSGPDPPARREAAEMIASMGSEALIETLDAVAEIPEDGNLFHISPPVFDALAEVGPSAVDGLSEALRSPKPNVRSAAAKLLRQMGHEAEPAMESLASVLDDDMRWVRWYAADALGNLEGDAAAAVDALLAAAGHEDHYTRRRAIVALGRIGPPAKPAAPLLRTIEQEDPDRTVRRAAVLARHQIDIEAIAAAATANAEGDLLEQIEKLSHGDEYQRVAAAKALSQLGPRAARAAPVLARALDDSNKWVREAAAEALGTIGREARNYTPFLEKRLTDEAPEVRAAAREALAQITGKR